MGEAVVGDSFLLFGIRKVRALFGIAEVHGLRQTFHLVRHFFQEEAAVMRAFVLQCESLKPHKLSSVARIRVRPCVWSGFGFENFFAALIRFCSRGYADLDFSVCGFCGAGTSQCGTWASRALPRGHGRF